MFELLKCANEDVDPNFSFKIQMLRFQFAPFAISLYNKIQIFDQE